MPAYGISLLSLPEEQDKERQKGRHKNGQIVYRFHNEILALNRGRMVKKAGPDVNRLESAAAGGMLLSNV